MKINKYVIMTVLGGFVAHKPVQGLRLTKIYKIQWYVIVNKHFSKISSKSTSLPTLYLEHMSHGWSTETGDIKWCGKFHKIACECFYKVS